MDNYGVQKNGKSYFSQEIRKAKLLASNATVNTLNSAKKEREILIGSIKVMRS